MSKQANYEYKCRRCGKIMMGPSGSGEMIHILQVMIDISVSGRYEGTGIPLGLYGTHCCDDGGYGFTDFIGCSVEEER